MNIDHPQKMLKLSQATFPDHTLRCKFCPSEFKKVSKLLRHERELHLHNIKLFPCQKCSKTFKRKEHLKRHFKGSHLGDKFGCPLCEVSYVETGRLKTHLKKVHKTLVCRLCSHFHSSRRTEDHTCPTHFSNEKGVKAQGKSKGTLYPCRKCKKCFFHLLEMEDHLEVEHGEIAPSRKDARVESFLVISDPAATSFASENTKDQTESNLSVLSSTDFDGSSSDFKMKPKKHVNSLHQAEEEKLSDPELFLGKRELETSSFFSDIFCSEEPDVPYEMGGLFPSSEQYDFLLFKESRWDPEGGLDYYSGIDSFSLDNIEEEPLVGCQVKAPGRCWIDL